MDILERAKEQLRAAHEHYRREGIVQLSPGIVPELVAEIERLRDEIAKLRGDGR